MDAGQAGTLSLFFPLFGGFSVLLAGWASDRIAGGGRGRIMTMALIPLVVVLALMGGIKSGVSAWVPVFFVSLSAFLMIGPYSFLAGAIALDLGGKQGSSTAAGMIDSAGYIGSILSGWGVGIVAERFGWSSVFVLLSGIGLITAVAALVYWRKYEGAVT